MVISPFLSNARHLSHWASHPNTQDRQLLAVPIYLLLLVAKAVNAYRHRSAGVLSTAAIALCAVLAVSLFSFGVGPFCVVHGPAATFRSLHFWRRLWASAKALLRRTVAGVPFPALVGFLALVRAIVPPPADLNSWECVFTC